MTLTPNYKELFAKLEANLARIERSENTIATLSDVVCRLVEDFHDDIGLTAARIYALEGDGYVLRRSYPRQPEHIGFTIPDSYEPMRQLLERGFVLLDRESKGIDCDLEAALGVDSFAAISIHGTRPAVIAFSLDPQSDRDHVIYALNTIRHVINLKLRKDHLEENLAQAQEIQASLLPSRPPRFGDFDIAARSVPAEEVGGDLYDFIPVTRRSLGLAIADSAGHGLPAALQARDAIVGLRMSIEERWRLTATIEKLNRIVGQSALISRFISLFYAEIELNGTVVYCNAGHNPPLLYDGNTFEELRTGGLILGPNPDAEYQRGYTRMRPGDVLVCFTDGIVEASNHREEMFGLSRLVDVILQRSDRSAAELTDAIFTAMQDFSRRRVPEDDQTVMVIKRKQPGAAQRR